MKNAQRLQPFPPNALEVLKKPVITARTFLKKEAKLVFLCGKKPNNDKPTCRDSIWKYCQKHIKDFQFFMAENFFEVYKNQDDLDLLTMEGHLSNFSDCIIIILESESTFAELGAFTIKDDLVENILVVNQKKYKNNESFISLGPIAKINKDSNFKPVIHADFNSVLSIMPEIEERLNKIKRKNDKTIKICNIDQFEYITFKERMLFLLDIITIFHPITRNEIVIILKNFYGDHKFDISKELSMLQAIRLVSKLRPKNEPKSNFYYFRTTEDQNLLYKYIGINEFVLRSMIINHHHKYSRKRIDILKEKIKIS